MIQFLQILQTHKTFLYAVDIHKKYNKNVKTNVSWIYAPSRIMCASGEGTPAASVIL